MSNRNEYKGYQSNIPELIGIKGSAAFDGSGDVTVGTMLGKRVSSITHVGTGTYRINFSEKYNELETFAVSIQKAAGMKLGCDITANDIDSSDTANAGASISLLFFNTSSGAAANPTSCTVRFNIEVKNSNLSQ